MNRSNSMKMCLCGILDVFAPTDCRSIVDAGRPASLRSSPAAARPLLSPSVAAGVEGFGDGFDAGFGYAHFAEVGDGALDVVGVGAAAAVALADVVEDFG